MNKKVVGSISAVLVIAVLAIVVAVIQKDDTKSSNSDSELNSASESTNTTGGQHANVPSGQDSVADPSTTTQETTSIAIEDFAFTPASIRVKKGATVTWTNKDSSPHTVTGVDSNKGPESGTLEAGDTYNFTFDEVGTFGYVCDFHPSMKGEVTVTE